MLANLFRSNRPAALLLVPVLALLLFAGSMVSPAEPADAVMPLYMLLQRLLALAVWVPGLASVVLSSLVAVQLAFLANNAELLGRRNHLPALLFLLLLATLGDGTPFEPMGAGGAMAGMPLVVRAMARTLSISNAGKALAALFDAGILLGLATLFYLPYAFLLAAVWAAVSVIRPFAWRDHLVPLLGLLVILYLAWAVLLLLDHHWEPFFTVVQGLRPVQAPHRAWEWIFIPLLTLLVGAALPAYASTYARGVMREKNLRASFMAFFAGSGVVIVFVHVLDGSFPAVLLAAPMAVFCSHALLGTKRAWLSEGAVLLLLALGLWSQWG